MWRRPLRIQRSGEVFVCSNRCFQDKLLIPTDPISTAQIEGALGRYANRYSVELYAYSFLPVGFWMVMGTNNKATRQHFMRDFSSWIATWVNRNRDRKGSLFHHRYEDEAVVDVQSLVDACVDVTVAPVREGFTEELDTYTGASSWSFLDSGESRVGQWIDRDELRSKRRTNPDLEEMACSVAYTVPLREPPVEIYAEEDGEELEADDEPNAHIRQRVKKRVERIVKWQSNLEPGELERRRAEPHHDPKNADPLEPLGPPKLRYSWLCRAGSEKRRGRYRTFRKKMRKRYTKAGNLWREGKEAFCECCGKEVHAAGREAATRGLAADGGAAKEVQDEGKIDGRCGNDLDFPDSAIPYGWIETKKPLLARTEYLTGSPDCGQ